MKPPGLFPGGTSVLASVLGLAAVLSGTQGCTPDPAPSPASVDSQPETPANSGAATAPAVNPDDVVVSDDDRAVFAEALGEFSMRLSRNLGDGGGNAFFSPWSVMTALLMTAEGARGVTASEMDDVLGIAPLAKDGDDGAAGRLTRAHAVLGRVAAEMAPVSGPALESLRERLGEAEARLAAAREGMANAKEFGPEWNTKRSDEETAVADVNRLRAGIDPYVLSMANSLWVDAEQSLEDPFVGVLRAFYGDVGPFMADFRNAFPRERERINLWVKERTAGRIEDLIPDLPPDEAAQMRLVLVNAVHFKGRWSEPFDPKATRDGVFHLAGGGDQSAPFMRQSGKAFAYAAFDSEGEFFETPVRMPRGADKSAGYPGAGGVQLLEIPYQGDRIVMLVALPADRDGLPAFETALTWKNLSAMRERLRPRTVDVRVPRFELKGDYELGGVLAALGMSRAFLDPRRPDGADFTGIHDTDDLQERLFIAKVLHQAGVEVTEEGTEAVAATAVMMATPTAALDPEFVPEFRADRPFLFWILDRPSGSVLFAGRLSDPSAGG